MRILGLIPARRGSKGIPGKNLYKLLDIPLIEYTIRAAMMSENLTDVFISTDDDKIIEIGRRFGIYSEYKRPDELAADTSGMVGVVIHAIEWLERAGRYYDAVMLLQPTSPLRIAEDIDQAINLYKSTGTRTLTSVHKMSEHPNECLKRGLTEWHLLEEGGINSVRRQDYNQNFYYINGALYITEVKFIKSQRSLLEHGQAELYEMPKARGVDIDNLDDLAYAEHLLRRRATQQND